MDRWWIVGGSLVDRGGILKKDVVGRELGKLTNWNRVDFGLEIGQLENWWSMIGNWIVKVKTKKKKKKKKMMMMMMKTAMKESRGGDDEEEEQEEEEEEVMNMKNWRNQRHLVTGKK